MVDLWYYNSFRCKTQQLKILQFILPNYYKILTTHIPCALHPCNLFISYLVVLEKTLENPLDCKEIQSVHPKGDQSWVFIGRTDAEAETPILWPSHMKSWLIGKDPDAGRGWRQEEKGTTEDEMAGWHHRLNGHEFEWILGVGNEQEGLVCCDSWGCKESDMTEWLNWTELNWIFHCIYKYIYTTTSLSIHLLIDS